MLESREVILASVAVLIVQIVTGLVNAKAGKRAVEEAENSADILASITIGKNSVQFDKSDILAIALAIFIFWAVGQHQLDAQDGLTAFVAVLAGTGAKEAIQAWLPGKK